MYITLEADYAVRIVTCLAGLSSKTDAKTIAAATGVSLHFALKILRKLADKGIVHSFKGARGGYSIAREPKSITLREVIETVEGEYCFSRCLDSTHEHNCDPKSCKAQAVYSQISDIVREKMNNVTIADII